MIYDPYLTHILYPKPKPIPKPNETDTKKEPVSTPK